MNVSHYYIGSRPVDEGDLWDVLLSALDGVAGILFDTGTDGFMDWIYAVSGPGDTADRINFVLNDDGARLDVWFAGEVVGTKIGSAIEETLQATAIELAAQLGLRIAAVGAIGVVPELGGYVLECGQVPPYSPGSLRI